MDYGDPLRNVEYVLPDAQRALHIGYARISSNGHTRIPIIEPATISDVRHPPPAGPGTSTMMQFGGVIYTDLPGR
jgi:hypothetical protein